MKISEALRAASGAVLRGESEHCEHAVLDAAVKATRAASVVTTKAYFIVAWDYVLRAAGWRAWLLRRSAAHWWRGKPRVRQGNRVRVLLRAAELAESEGS